MRRGAQAVLRWLGWEQRARSTLTWRQLQRRRARGRGRGPAAAAARPCPPIVLSGRPSVVGVGVRVGIASSDVARVPVDPAGGAMGGRQVRLLLMRGRVLLMLRGRVHAAGVPGNKEALTERRQLLTDASAAARQQSAASSSPSSGGGATPRREEAQQGCDLLLRLGLLRLSKLERWHRACRLTPGGLRRVVAGAAVPVRPAACPPIVNRGKAAEPGRPPAGAHVIHSAEAAEPDRPPATGAHVVDVAAAQAAVTEAVGPRGRVASAAACSRVRGEVASPPPPPPTPTSS